MADIFISYAREDETRIKELVRALEEQGWSIFWDRRIPSGKSWESYIEQNLSDAKCVIVAWSHQSINSKWVKLEATDAEERGVIVPVLLDRVKPPLAFRDIQAADLVNWDPAQSSPEFEKLISDISILLGPSPKHIKETEQAAEEERKRKQEEETKRKESRRLYKVFVSSTFLDNQERRKLVQDAITSAGMVWHGMEIFTASTRPTVEECLRYAKEADLLVGIIASRYGWEPDGN